MDDLVQRSSGTLNGIGFLLVAELPGIPHVVATAWCRRTWCNHLVLDLLATNPSYGRAQGFRHVGISMLLALAHITRRLEIPLIWGRQLPTRQASTKRRRFRRTGAGCRITFSSVVKTLRICGKRPLLTAPNFSRHAKVQSHSASHFMFPTAPVGCGRQASSDGWKPAQVQLAVECRKQACDSSQNSFQG